jgi:prepilin-type processing-associated H-X9-DG protein
VCGILGPCTAGLAAVAGLILGIVALSRIAKSAGQLTGRGLAIAGIILSAATPVLLAIVAMVAAILMPAVFGARDMAKSSQSMSNVKQLCVSAQVYADSHRQQLPPADSWPEALRNYGIDDQILADPSEPDAGRAYAMNAALSGLHFGAVRDRQRMVLFFECRPGAPPGGGPELLPDEPRHAGRYVIGFLDGHVERVAPEEVGRLIWQPKREPGF